MCDADLARENERLRAALKSVREWVVHWQRYRYPADWPTADSMSAAITEIDAALKPAPLPQKEAAE